VYWREFQSVVLLHIYASPLDLPAEQLVLTEGQRIQWFSLEAAQEQPLHAWVRAMLPEFTASEVYRGILETQASGDTPFGG
jgi:hypothetical protein